MESKSKTKKQPSVNIIIVTYNSDLKLLRGCLDSLKKVTNYNNYKVIISDNGSKNGVQDIIKKDYKWVDLLENNAYIYFAGGSNSAIKYSLKKYNPDYYFLLNDDVLIVDKNWLSELVKTAESDSKIGLVGANPIYPNGISQNVGGYIKGPLITLEKKATGLMEFDHITAFFLAKRKVIEKVGLFDVIFHVKMSLVYARSSGPTA
jgi:GT2 family glycosyltransferase